MTEKINITFLGTGSAVPTAKRNHPATLVQYKEENLLFDCGEGTQRQFRIAKLNPCKISKIFISHWHGDHVFGLSGLIQTLAMSNYARTLKIYGPRGTKEKVELYKKLYIFKGQEIKVEAVDCFRGVILDEKEFFIECIELEHDCPCLAFSFVIKERNRIDKKKLEKLKLPNSPLIGELLKGKTVLIEGKKIDGKKLVFKEESRKITYVADTRFTENAIKLAKDSNILICESTFSKEEEQTAKEYAHLTSEHAATIAKKAKVKSLNLIHLSQRYENPKIILEEAKKIFKNTAVPNDFDKIEV